MLTTFFTAADRRYEHYAIPYALGVLASNPDAVVEICLEDPDRFARRNAAALAILGRHHPDRFRVRAGQFGGRFANSVRFIEAPEHRSTYTYIGDIDILVLEHVSPLHVRRMAETGLPYSNILRPGGQKLSGLHFTTTDRHYPVDLSGLDLGMNDEVLLRHLVEKDGLPRPEDTWRPVHGLHLSPSRRPFGGEGEPGWGLTEWVLRDDWEEVRSPHVDRFLSLRGSDLWREVEPHFDLRFVLMQLLLQTAIDSRFPDLLEHPGGLASHRSLSARVRQGLEPPPKT